MDPNLAPANNPRLVHWIPTLPLGCRNNIRSESLNEAMIPGKAHGPLCLCTLLPHGGASCMDSLAVDAHHCLRDLRAHCRTVRRLFFDAHVAAPAKVSG